jgi:hypothetical protein
LQRFQPERAPQNNCGNQKHAVGVSQTERESQKSECREMFELSTGKYWTGIDRG